MKIILLFMLIAACIVSAAFAETPVQNTARITFETRVFNWSFAKQEWAEAQLIRVLVQQFRDNVLVAEELSDGKNGLLEKTIFAYEAGIVKKTCFNAAGKLIRTSTVTIRGDTETETVKRIDGNIFQQYVTKRDGSGRILLISHLDAAGKLVFRKEYVYDTRGLVVYIRNFNPDDSLAVEIRYEYKAFDPDGNWLRREEYYSYGDVKNRPHETVLRKME